jgi:hypothetical protein
LLRVRERGPQLACRRIPQHDGNFLVQGRLARVASESQVRT